MEPAQIEFFQMCRALLSQPEGEKLIVLALNSEIERQIKKNVPNATTKQIPYGDIWLRDTGPIFSKNDQGRVFANLFKFNGWGGKYLLKHDEQVGAQIAEFSGKDLRRHEIVMEGGSLEIDEFGTCLTTEQCLLNPNRNPGMDRKKIEGVLFESLGARNFIWLKEGLVNDHTDGHIDTLARFVGNGRVICMRATKKNDPNKDIFQEISHDLSRAKTNGQPLNLIEIPSPGLIESEDGDVMPASYVNFIIGNKVVVVPTYGVDTDAQAVELIGQCFPDRKTVGVSARAILTGGGAFHCITQQEPL